MSQDANVQRRGTLAGLVTCMRGMLATGELSDFEFHIGQAHGEMKSFRVHKYVLSMRSPVFRAMFYGSMAKPGQNTEDIPDIHPEAFANILSFMYTDKVDDLDPDNAFATWVAADRYDLPLLVEMASKCVVNTLNVSNCWYYLEKTGRLAADCERLQKKCLELVDVHSDVVFQSKDCDTLPLTSLKLILERDTLTAEENVIYQAVERWARAACLRSDEEPSPAMRRSKLGDALQLVRFPLLTDVQLAEGPGMTGLLTEQERITFVCASVSLTNRRPSSGPSHASTEPGRPAQLHFPMERSPAATQRLYTVHTKLFVLGISCNPGGRCVPTWARKTLPSGWKPFINAGVHVVQHDNREYSVQFRDMTMRTGQVMARKAVLLG
ncbi:BTB/POZ domain-containing protein 6-A-like [Paramacrobiotus metropolitanus]|uniref:BTB/POZ domain-containing protein 6-A-like n=1 Tax=Paramacrobiotus metropolitanus TaxID=2943436 RepID=UPI002445CCEB|nr:BTB/POZ domain-containing protein 6-A-like [Paramacrobiotus metropolitanus]